MSSFPFLPRTISLVDRHSGIYQGTGRCRCSHSTGAITADTVQIERSGCSGTSADSEHLYSITHRPYPTPATLTLSYFNPRSPCGERRAPSHSRRNMPHHFNPRSLAGSDSGIVDALPSSQNFNPRSPCGERRLTRWPDGYQMQISIHAPLAGSDNSPNDSTTNTINFNPRSPCGERLALSGHP